MQEGMVGAEGAEGQRAFDDLAAYYRNNQQAPPYAKALDDLGKGDAATRQKAGRYLLALMVQSPSDVQHGRSPVRMSPFWRAGASQDARNVRNIILGAFIHGARNPEALDAVAWLLANDRMLDDIPRSLLGHVYHQEMLEAFSYRRDYARTRALAAPLGQLLFDGHPYQERARELDTQLARRADDFKSLALPAPGRWKEMKATMDRGQQIRCLAQHLRLLDCRQWGQPGGVSFGGPQDAQPMEGGSRQHPVVNPLVELGSMKLQRADLRHLVPFLADEDFMPCFSYFRDFHPQRHLYRVNEIVADVFNQVAKSKEVSLAAYIKGSLQVIREDYKSTDVDGRVEARQVLEDNLASGLSGKQYETVESTFRIRNCAARGDAAIVAQDTTTLLTFKPDPQGVRHTLKVKVLSKDQWTRMPAG